MGQAECIKALKGRNWISTKKVAKILKQSTKCATASLRRLFKQGEIDRRELEKHGGYEWKISR